MNWRNDKLERKGEGLGVVKEEGESEKGREKVGGEVNVWESQS